MSAAVLQCCTGRRLHRPAVVRWGIGGRQCVTPCGCNNRIITKGRPVAGRPLSIAREGAAMVRCGCGAVLCGRGQAPPLRGGASNFDVIARSTQSVGRGNPHLPPLPIRGGASKAPFDEGTVTEGDWGRDDGVRNRADIESAPTRWVSQCCVTAGASIARPRWCCAVSFWGMDCHGHFMASQF